MNKTYILAGVLVVVVIAAIILNVRGSPSTVSYQPSQPAVSTNEINPPAANFTAPTSTTDTTSTPNSFTPIPIMQITSPAFSNNGSIPSKYTCDVAAPVSPPLSFLDVPANTKSLALIVQDPDVPQQVLPAGVFDHWVAFNIPPETTVVAEGSAPGTQGNNGAGKPGYAAPCPPAQFQPNEHRYIFTVYALDNTLALQPGATKQQVQDAIANHVLGQADLVGRYKKIGAK